MSSFTSWAFRPLLDGAYEDKLDFVREQTILKKGAFYFDWTASGLANRIIESRVLEILPYYANTHSTSAKHAMLIQSLYEESKRQIRQSLGLSEDFVVLACGSGATGAIKKFQELLGIYLPPESRKVVEIKQDSLPLVVVGAFEHHSNEVSFREGLCEVFRIPLKENLEFDLEACERVLEANRHRKIILSYSLLSNVTGNLAPFNELAALGRKYGCVIVLDMASSSPDFQLLDCDSFDACFLSPHKLLGGVGSSGLLCIRKSLIDTRQSPTFAGGGVVFYVDRQTQIYRLDEELREEAGTPPILQVFRAALAYRLRDEMGLEWIRQRKHTLMRIFLKSLKQIPEVEIYGSEQHLGIVSFNIAGLSPFKLSYLLSTNYNIQTRAGCSCAGPYGHDLLGLEDGVYRGEEDPYGWLRVSLHYTHSREDIEYFFGALGELVGILKPL